MLLRCEGRGLVKIQIHPQHLVTPFLCFQTNYFKQIEQNVESLNHNSHPTNSLLYEKDFTVLSLILHVPYFAKFSQ